MSDTVIQVNNISKQYRLGLVGTGTLSHDLKRWWYRARGKEDPYLKIGEQNIRNIKGGSDYVWALKDINFEVKRGEVLGIIGKNGAGKSTLLKILSRITLPTTGEFKIKGRIASLLEVGTGFHPELTGRENIFLNGAILGMTKTEIRSKFDEIVAFSGVERYIDTPVKRYSSGMYVRLAFAVAAHLEPEILIIDEVLAVGDAEFQKKCLGKMKDVAGEGRTVLFVSHNMTAVKTLCSRVLLLKNGNTDFLGNVNEAISLYMGGNIDIPNQSRYFAPEDYNNSPVAIYSIEIKSHNENPQVITMADSFTISVNLEKKIEDLQLDVTMQVTDTEGNVLLINGSGSATPPYDNYGKAGKMEFECTFPSHFFNQGDFAVNILLVENNKKLIQQLNGILNIAIMPSESKLGVWMGKSKGYFRLPDSKWKIKYA